MFTDEATGAQVTTGTPIALAIDNVDQRSKDYSDIKDKYRPGHADYTYDVKYGLRDYRGGGRQSARETAHAGRRRRDRAQDRARHDACAARSSRWASTRSTARAGAGTRSSAIRSSVRTPRRRALLEDYLDAIRKRGSSIGAVIEVIADGVPAGLGAPIYGKLDADLAAALMGINAVKGVEIGAGFGAAALTGEENADEIRIGNDGKPRFLSNSAGGILGGISTGQPIVCRFAVKPTSSILTPRRTVDRYGAETEIATKGRHDPCVGIRAVPIGEAMVACVIADHYLRHRGQVGEPPAWPAARGD